MLARTPEQVRDCYERANECRRRAGTESHQEMAAFWREQEARWIRPAESEDLSARIATFLDLPPGKAFSAEAEEGVQTLADIFTHVCRAVAHERAHADRRRARRRERSGAPVHGGGEGRRELTGGFRAAPGVISFPPHDERPGAIAMTSFTRRTVLAGLAAAPFVRSAHAADWPARPVRVIVPYPPAGGADTTGRILLGRLSEDMHQQFVLEIRGGAGGTIGEAVVAKADPDGYTLLHDATGFSVNGSLYPKLPFDYKKDFEPVFLVSLVPNILIVSPSVPVNTAKDVIDYAKAQKDGIDMASSGNGTLQHLCLEMLRKEAAIKITHAPYRGGGLALNDVMGGQVKFFFANGSSVVGQIKGEKVRAIAHTGKGRLGSLPDIPAASDTLPGFEAYEWNGVFVPHGTPAAIAQKLNAGLNSALTTPEVQQRFSQLNIDSRPNTQDEFKAFVSEQMEKWAKIVKEANIRLG